MNSLYHWRAACLCLLLLFVSKAHTSETFLHRAEVRAYLDEIAQEHDLDRNQLAGLFSRVSSQQGVLDLMSRPAEKTLTWLEYRPIFVTEQRIKAGRTFFEEHLELLRSAEKQYGVPAEIIAAIIGVETFYGRITGNFGVLEALATLAFDYPKRAAFFRKELTEYILLAGKEQWDIHSVKGSYAGAMGMPQFIASSYRMYAVDFDEDGVRDLFANPADIIGSVANYFDKHGWITGAPVVEPWQSAVAVNDQVRDLVTESLQPSVAAQRVQELGFASSQLKLGTADEKLLSVMTFNGVDAEETWLGYWNFYVITRYNHSRLYAMAVYQLANAIQESAS